MDIGKGLEVEYVVVEAVDFEVTGGTVAKVFDPTGLSVVVDAKVVVVTADVMAIVVDLDVIIVDVVVNVIVAEVVTPGVRVEDVATVSTVDGANVTGVGKKITGLPPEIMIKQYLFS